MMFRSFRVVVRTVPLLVCTAGLSGCLSPLQKQSAALATATTPVAEQATAAYQASNTLWDTAQDYEAYRAFENSTKSNGPSYDPKIVTTRLLTDHDIAVRVKALQALQLYVQNVVAITNGVDSPALQAASKSVGENVTGLGNDLAPSIEATLGIAAPTSSSTTTYNSTNSVTNANGTTNSATNTVTTATVGASLFTPQMRNGVTVAMDALGQFLVSRKIKKELPGIVIDMDPKVKQLCELLESDIDVLQPRAQRDFDTILDQRKFFIVNNAALPQNVLRDEIMKQPDTVRLQRTADDQFKVLRASLVNLYNTHHALAAVAQKNNPTSLKSNLAQLAAAGSNLGTLYSSLPSK